MGFSDENYKAETETELFKPREVINLIGFMNGDKLRKCTNEFEDYIRPKYSQSGHRLYYKSSLNVLKRIKELRQDAEMDVAEVKMRLDYEGFECYAQTSEDESTSEPVGYTGNVNYQLIQAMNTLIKNTAIEEERKTRAAMREIVRDVKDTVNQNQEQNEKLIKQQNEIIKEQMEMIRELTHQVDELHESMEKIKEQTKKKRWFEKKKKE